MPVTRIRAGDVKPGMILASGLDHEIFSVKKVFVAPNRALGYNEITIDGPLKIRIKRRVDSPIAILI